MKVGDLVRTVSAGKTLVGVILEVKTYQVTDGPVRFNKKMTEIRVWCPQRPSMSTYWSDPLSFDVIREAK